MWARAVAAVLFLAAPLAVVAPCHAESAPSPPKVLLLHAYGNYQPSVVAFDGGFRTAVERASLDVYYEYLDSARTPADAAVSLIAAHLREKYQHTRLAAVVAVSDEAVEFLQSHQLFRGVPVVAVTRRTTDLEYGEGTGVVRVWGGPAAADTAELALRLHPGTDRLVVVTGRPEDDPEYDREVLRQLQPYAAQVAITRLTGLPEDQLLDQVARLTRGSVILLGRLAPPTLAMASVPRNMYERIANTAPVPVYSLEDGTIGTGVVGMSSPTPGETGALAGTLVASVARGAAVDNPAIPVLSAATPIVDARQLERWGVQRARLPAGTIVRFDRPGFWTQNWEYVVGSVAVGLLETGLIVALMLQRVRRQRVEDTTDAILRAIPDLMFLQSTDGTYIEHHSVDPSHLLVPPEQFLGRRMQDILPSEMLRVIEPAFRRTATAKEPTTVEYHVEIAGGTRHYEARLVPCASDKVLSVVRDVTDHRRSDRALRDSRAQYELATAAGGVGVWDLDLTRREIYLDPALEALLGYRIADVGTTIDAWKAHVHPDDVPVVASRAQAVVDGQTRVYEGEHRMVQRDGTVRWFLARGTLVESADGQPRMIGTGTDITERKESERALNAVREELSRTARLTALGKFAASIAHEVRQPLTAILANAYAGLNLVKSRAAEGDEVEQALADIVSAAKRADAVIARNRDLFRDRTVQRSRIDLNVTIAHTALLARAQLHDARVVLRVRLAPNLPMVMADTIELQQVLLNLTSNGIESMERVPVQARRLSITSAITAAGAQVRVRDTGVGLSGVDLERLFTMPYTTKPRGTGVGLSICREIIEAHGGHIWAEQNEGQGATFAFSIPFDVSPS